MTRNPLEWLAEILVSITTIPVLAMMVHVTLDVLLKYIWNTPIQGTLEITAYYYMVAIVVLPMAFIELTRQSIAVDLFYQMMGGRLQLVVTALVLLISGLGYGGLAYISWPDALQSLAKKEIVMGTVNIYIWPSRFLMPAALAVAAVVCFYHLIRLLTNSSARAELTAIHQVDPDTEVH